MKKLLFALALGATFVSCEQKPEKAVATGHGPANNIFSKAVDSFYIDYDTAKQKINNWKNFANSNQLPQGFLSSSAFVIPASTVKYLIDSNKEDYVVFYLALNNTGDSLSLVYQGGKRGVENGDSIIEFTPVREIGQVRYALDNTWPCPVCPVDGFIKAGYKVPLHSIERSKR